MTTYILKENDVDKYYEFILKNELTINQAKLKISILGYEELEVEEAKRKANVGDCLLFTYDGKLVPFQILQKDYIKDENGNEKLDCIMQAYYLLEKRAFDKKTNIWRDAEIRHYLNGDFLKKLDPELVNLMKVTDVHTDDYVTKDRVWLPSHEEIGYEDKNGMFKINIGAKCYEYYKDGFVSSKDVA